MDTFCTFAGDEPMLEARDSKDRLLVLWVATAGAGVTDVDGLATVLRFVGDCAAVPPRVVT